MIMHLTEACGLKFEGMNKREKTRVMVAVERPEPLQEKPRDSANSMPYKVPFDTFTFIPNFAKN